MVNDFFSSETGLVAIKNPNPKFSSFSGLSAKNQVSTDLIIVLFFGMDCYLLDSPSSPDFSQHSVRSSPTCSEFDLKYPDDCS